MEKQTSSLAVFSKKAFTVSKELAKQGYNEFGGNHRPYMPEFLLGRLVYSASLECVVLPKYSRIPWVNILESLYCAVAGLKFLRYDNSIPIIHRNVKLENILFERGSYNFKLCNFSFDGYVTDYYDRMELEETNLFLAPEYIDRPGATYTPRTDTWMLGVSVYRKFSACEN